MIFCNRQWYCWFVMCLNIKLKSPKLKIALIGKIDRPFSASTGAGAMANVYAEIAKGPFKDQIIKILKK